MPVMWSAGTVDQWPKNLACAQLFGNPWSDPDPRRAPHRPVRRHGRQPARLAGLAAVVPRPDGRDRRASASAAAARSSSTRAAPAPPSAPTSGSRSCPGTDAAFLLAIVHVLDDEGSDPASVALDGSGPTGSTRCCAAAQRLLPRGGRRRRAASTAERIRASPATWPHAERAVVYGRIGLCKQEFGTLASGWSTSSTSSPATSTPRAARCSRRPRDRHDLADRPTPGRR